MQLNFLSKPQKIPAGPGVYIFQDKYLQPLYIGKAANLKKRLSYYWKKGTPPKIQSLLREARHLKLRGTKSEIEALLLESQLIKKHHPRYNVLLRDDKNYFYAAITRDAFAKIFITHKMRKDARHIGPFTSGAALKTTLKLLRKIFSYCTCKIPHRRPCINAELNRCWGFCCAKNAVISLEQRQIYRASIKNVLKILNGKARPLLKGLERSMRNAVSKQEFEKAVTLRDQISGLKNVLAHRISLDAPALSLESAGWIKIQKVLQIILKTRKKISRVEGYDISNISGIYATGSMVVFVDGQSVKSEYKKFRIKTVQKISDTDCLREIIGRRMRHSDWTLPDMLLIDGGKAQLNAAGEASRLVMSKPTLIAALAKQKEELYIKGRRGSIPLSSLPPPTAFFLQNVRDESHRFALSYHRLLRRKNFHEKKIKIRETDQ